MEHGHLLNKLTIILESASVDKEHDELNRVVQYLNREEDIDISVQDLRGLFSSAPEVKLKRDIWDRLENTESNTIKKGDFLKVKKIASKYNKTNPEKLAQKLKSDTYNRPLILKFKDRYHLVAGNTRLCTAAALGMTPNVIIAELTSELSEENVTGNVAGYSTPNAFMATPPRKKDKKKRKENLKGTYATQADITYKFTKKLETIKRHIDEISSNREKLKKSKSS